MDLESLKAYCMVVDSGSISKAAKKLFVSQPSLSMKVQDLENHYHTVLLERTNKGVRPTEDGLILYQHARKILAIDESIERNLDRSRISSFPRLTVGAATTIGDYALPCTVYNFQEKYPQYKISMKISNSENVVEQVINRHVDIGLVEGPLTKTVRERLASEGIKARRVSSTALILIVPNEKNYDSVQSISLDKDFARLPLILREKGSGIRTTLELALAARWLSVNDLNVVMELDTTNAIISAVTSGKGVAILPKMAVRKELHYNIVREVPIDGMLIKHAFTTLYHEDDIGNPIHDAFIKFLHSKERGFC
jgi:LysR family transcriptional regulator, transcriptional activator of the cysJI operon